MAGHNSWMTPYLFGQPQFEKPPLTYWLLRIGFAVFGVSSFGARFFPALFGLVGVIATYRLGLLGFKDEKKAFLSAVILMSSGLYIGLARVVLTDMIFSVIILLSLVSFYWGYSVKERKAAGILLFFVFMGLAVLAKGPLGLFIPSLAVAAFLLVRRDAGFMFCKCSLLGVSIFAVIALPWYIFMIRSYGSAFIQEFFINDHVRRILEAEHPSNDRWYFYPVSMIGCMFPWSLFVAASLVFLYRHLRQKENSFYVFLTCQVIVIFLVFEWARSKLVSYVFPAFPALALIAGGFIYDAVSEKKNYRTVFFVCVTGLFCLSLIPAGLVFGMLKYSSYIMEYLHSRTPVYSFILTVSVLCIATLFFILKGRLLKGVYCFALAVPVYIFHIPLVAEDIEPHLSTSKSCEYLLKNYRVDNTILCSKLYLRGVRYFTDKEVAVIDIPGKQFFSPHPVPFLNTGEKVLDFLRRQKVTYCILKKSSIKDIDRIMTGEFKGTLLNRIGNENILKIESVR